MSTTAVKPVANHMLSAETASVAKYLESDPVYRDTEYIVSVWNATGMDRSVLAEELEELIRSVAARGKLEGRNITIDLEQVDWNWLAERYVDLFAG